MAVDRHSYAVLLVDPRASVRLALRWALEEVPGLWVVAEAGTAAAARSLASSHRIDLALIEVDLPDEDGFTLTAALRSLARPPDVLLLTLRTEPDQVGRARQAGAAALLEKGAGWEALFAAVQGSLDARDSRARAI